MAAGVQFEAEPASAAMQGMPRRHVGRSGHHLRTVLIGVVAAMLILSAAHARGSAPAHIAAVDNVPTEFVVADKSKESAQFIDIGRVLRLSDGTIAAHNYIVLRDGRSFQGRAWTYTDLVVQYNCNAGSVIVRSGLLIGEDFALVGSLQIPKDGKRWLAKQDPDVANTYGYPELCKTATRRSLPRIGRGQSWRTVAASQLAELRTD